MKIKVLFFLPNLLGGGAERVAVNILNKIDYNKIDINLILVSEIGELLELVPRQVNIINLNKQKTIYSIFELRRLLKEIKPDIVFSTLFRTSIALNLALTFIRKKPVIINRCPNSPKLLLEYKELKIFNKFLTKIAYKDSDLIIAQTPEMKQELIQYLDVRCDKIKHIINPIDEKNINNSLKEISNPFNKKHINIVAAGRLNIQKGFDILIRSMKDVIQINNNYRLYIIGADNGEKVKLEKLIKEFNLEKYVFLLGFKKNPYKYFYFSNLYVLSSRWEGLPNTILENLYLSKPIISTKCIPYLSNIIEDKKNGLLVEVEDIQSLTEAILNYKSIDVNYKTIDFKKNQFEEIFLNFVHKGIHK